MLEPTMRELMGDAGVQNISIRTDNKGLLGTGEFPGTEQQAQRRLNKHFDVQALGSADEPTIVRCRPKK